MNLFFKSYTFSIFFLLTCALNTPLLLGQNAQAQFTILPEISNFDIPARFNQTASTSFIRDINGVVYIGKQNGLLIIDDDKYSFLPFDNAVYLTYSNKKKIVYMTTFDFGYVDYNSQSGPSVMSCLDKLRSNFQDFFPNNLTSFEQKSFLATSEGVIIIKNDTITHLFFNRKNCSLFNSGHYLFLQVEDEGLYIWKDEEFKLAISSPELYDVSISSIVDFDKIVLLYTESGVIYEFNPEELKAIISQNQVSPFLDYRLIKELDSDQYICIDEKNMLYICPGFESNIINLSASGNIPLSSPVSVFIDQFSDIWILYDFSLVKVEFPSKSNIIDLSDQISGSILSTALSGDNIYLGTNNGLFELGSEDNKTYNIHRIIDGNGTSFTKVISVDDIVIAAGNTGIYELSGNLVYQIVAGGVNFIHLFENTTFLTVDQEGLKIYRKSGGNWTSDVLDSSAKQIMTYAEFEGLLWIQSSDHVLRCIDADRGIINRIENMNAKGFGNLFVYCNKLFLSDESSVYEWSPVNGKFLKKTFPGSEQLLSSELLISTEDHLWSVRKDDKGIITIWKLGKDNKKTPFYEISGAKNLGQIMDIDETKDHIWISGRNKLVRLDQVNGNNLNDPLLRLNSVKISFQGKSSGEMNINPFDQIRYRKSNICFDLSSIRYQNDPSPYFRYRLSHYQEEWSEWSKEKSILFNNLRERDYTFEAQSVSAFGIMSEPLSFSFTISPPLYRKWFAYMFYIIIIFISAFLLYKWRLLQLKHVEFRLEERIRERMASVLNEKEKSDRLVADLFPKGTAEEIKLKGRAESKKFEMATVLFSDIQGFTKIAEEMNPEVLIDELDKFFFHFDSVVEKYNIEKIKTIGDAYMAAGGIPVKNSSNPVEVVLAGIEMQYYMNDLKKKKTEIWDLRIGIHTGPIISGVVGHKKLSYDIWGDTVNTASRMESSGEPGKVNISGTTYSLVKEFFICEYRGKLPVKYKGNIDMYFVNGLRPELSVDLQGIPNKRFFIKLQLLRLQDIEERVFEEIQNNHSLTLHFHKNDFIHKTFTQTELLGRSESLSDDDMLLVQTAAILMYSGLSESYENFENKSAEIARSILPEYQYDERQIDRVCHLILSTKEPFKPQNILESILIDSKMEYLGRSDYLTQVKLLYLEEKSMLKDISKEKFIKKQIAKLESFEYFTLAAQRLREIPVKEQVNNFQFWK